MSITDELREFAKRWPCTDYRCKDMLAIADRIDAYLASEVEAVGRKARKEGWNECAAVRKDALQNALVAQQQKIYADIESTHVKLPVDADDVPICVGDEIDLPCGRKEEVRYMVLNGAGWLVNEAGWLPDHLHHHRPPIVEDVLTELLETAVGYCDAHTTVALDAVAEYAAKLQLKEDE